MSNECAALSHGERANAALQLLDLPAEIRNQVYRDALVFDSLHYYGSRTCTTALLATCKQVHKEAEEILYAENEVVIRLASTRSTDPRVELVTLTANGRDVSYVQKKGRLHVEWPGFLKRIGQVRVGCSLNHDPSDARASVTMCTVNNIIYHLNYMLLSNPRLDRIRIDVTNNVPFVSWECKDMLAPLSLFGQRAQLDFQGLPYYMIQSILEESLQVDPSERFNVVKMYLKLSMEAKSCIHVFAGSKTVLKALSAVKDLLTRVENNLPMTGRMMTVSKDKQLKQYLRGLDAALKCIDSKDVKAIQ